MTRGYNGRQDPPTKHQLSPRLNTLPDARKHQPLVVAARLSLDPAGQVAMVPLLVRPADVGHVIPVPVWEGEVSNALNEKKKGGVVNIRKRTIRLTRR